MSSINPSNQPYSSNPCTHGPAFQSPRHPISIHSQSYLSNQPSFQPASFHPSNYQVIHTSFHPTSHYFILRSIQTTIQQQSMYSSSILSATPTSYHPSIHKAIYLISHPSKPHQSIRPPDFPESYTFIHPTSHYVIP